MKKTFKIFDRLKGKRLEDLIGEDDLKELEDSGEAETLREYISFKSIFLDHYLPREDVLRPKRIATLEAKAIGELEIPQSSSADEAGLTGEGELIKRWYVDFIVVRGYSSFNKRGIFGDRKKAASAFRSFRTAKTMDADDYSLIFGEEIIPRINSFIEGKMWSHFLYFDVLQDEKWPASLPAMVLQGAGILDVFYRLTDEVLLFIGSDRILHLLEKFPETWQYVVEMEYCQRNTHIESPAYLAAAVRYTENFSNEQRISGYLLRDLEVLLMEFEKKLHESRLQQDENAVKSKAKTSNIKLERWESLIDGLEDVVAKLARGRKWKIEQLAANTIQSFRDSGDERWKGNITRGAGEGILTNVRSGKGGDQLRERLRQLEDALQRIVKST